MSAPHSGMSARPLWSRQRRRGFIELASGTLLLILVLTGMQAGALPPEVFTIGGITAVFAFGAGYADIRSKATAAHRRLDEKHAADDRATSEFRQEMKELREAVQGLALDLAGAGVIAPRDRHQPHGGR